MFFDSSYELNFIHDILWFVEIGANFISIPSSSKYWRNNPVELGPSLSGFLDKFASFPRLVCQTNVLNPLLRKGTIPSITWESNPAPLG
jgi:hypothetical protein